MRANASALFHATFGVAPRAAASAPGRVNLIGEHTDYNGGPVLPVACAARTYVAVGPAAPGVLEIASTREGQVARIDYREGRPAGWGAYLAGVMRELVALGAAPAASSRRNPESTSSRRPPIGMWRTASDAHSSSRARPGRASAALIWSMIPQRTPT